METLTMNEESQVLLHHIYQRLLVFEKNINRLNFEFFASGINFEARFRLEDMKAASEQIKIEEEGSQVLEKQLILALLEKLETLEVELVEIRMVYVDQVTKQNSLVSNLIKQNLVLSNRLRNQTIMLLKKFPPLFSLLKKLRGFYILKKSSTLNSLSSQTKKKTD
jgi:hypothetical protein